MKFLINKSTALVLISGVIGSIFATNLSVVALPEEEIVNKLRTVVVFAIVNDKGSPLVTLVDNQRSEKPVFITRNDAQSFINQKLAPNQNGLVEQLKVREVFLADIYQLIQEDARNKNNSRFRLTPNFQEVSSAERILGKGETFQEVPLFFVSFQKDAQTVTYFQRKQGEESVIPLFFEKRSAEEMIAQFQRENPDLNPQLEIGVTSLELVLKRFEKEDNETVRKMVLEPTEESLEFLRSL